MSGLRCSVVSAVDNLVVNVDCPGGYISLLLDPQAAEQLAKDLLAGAQACVARASHQATQTRLSFPGDLGGIDRDLAGANPTGVHS